MGEARGNAAVLGAGMAGLLSARVLSDFYESVTVVERDVLPDAPQQRRGVWQGRHLHALLSRGWHILEDLFPGLGAELVEAGALLLADGDLSRVYTRIGRYGLNRTQKFADPETLAVYLASRPFIEYHVRRRVAALGNVAIVDGHDAVEPIGRDRNRVVGVRIASRENSSRLTLDTTLVVDATGRGARLPTYLESIGYGRPQEQRSSAYATYSSQLLRVPEGAITEKLMMIVEPGPGNPRGALTAYEHGNWMLTVGRAALDPDPPVVFDEMLAFAEQLAPAAIMAGLRRAEPIGDVAVFRYTGAVWRRYDRMPRFPLGLLVIGDALCSVNPIYGQGMTLAALQAVALRESLRVADDDIAHRFFSATTDLIRPVWSMNEARDNAPAPGQRPRSVAGRVRSWTMRRVMVAAERDIVLTEIFQRIASLVDPPTRLRDPALLPRVVAANLYCRRNLARRSGRQRRARLHRLMPRVGIHARRWSGGGARRCGHAVLAQALRQRAVTARGLGGGARLLSGRIGRATGQQRGRGEAHGEPIRPH